MRRRSLAWGSAEGDRVLDIGCGSGAFLRLAADRGANVAGVDASDALIEVARRRLPDADVGVGDMEALPFGDDEFDLVTGFNSFFFAGDIVAALREAGRVARADAPVVIQVWGNPEHSDIELMKALVRPYMPPPPPNQPARTELSKPGVLEELATAAGLEPQEAFDVTWSYEYADAQALADGMMAAGGRVGAGRARARAGPAPSDRRHVRAPAHAGRPLPPRERVPHPDRPRLSGRHPPHSLGRISCQCAGRFGPGTWRSATRARTAPRDRGR